MIATLAGWLRPDSPAHAVRFIAALALVPMTLLSIWIWFGLSRPSLVLILEGYQMVLLAPAWLILIGSLWTRHWTMALVAAFVAISHAWFCLPAATADATPDWVEGAPTFTMYSVNVLYLNDDFDGVIERLNDIDAEVVVMSEMTEPMYNAMDEAGVFDRYPTVQYWRARPFGELLMTRLDVSESGTMNLGGMGVPWARIEHKGATVTVHGVHVAAPKNRTDRHVWRRNLDAIGRAAEAAGDNSVVFAGDFNSTLWHGPYRRYVLDRGLTDAHDQRGEGLSRTWRSPIVPLRWLGPIMGLDRVVVSDGVYVTSIENVETPGSDHQGVRTTIAIRPNGGE